jgi:hypothetical protein
LQTVAEIHLLFDRDGIPSPLVLERCIRSLQVRPGDLIVYTLPSYQTMADDALLERLMIQLKQLLDRMAVPYTSICLIAPGASLQSLDEEDLRRLGLQRI